jgi:hypothetical protein
MAAASQNSCESSFFMWILSTDEPKDFRLTGQYPYFSSGVGHLMSISSRSVAARV